MNVKHPSSLPKTPLLSSQRIRLGTYFGIGLYVHWTFTLLIGYVMYVTWAAGAAAPMIAFSVAQLLAVFICVTLHEYGHALAARRYGVGTHDITLLPIGGVARLKQIPRIPFQEFVIAVAGPAVNVVIAGVLLVLILSAGGGWLLDTLLQSSAGEMTAEQSEMARRASDQLFESPTLLGFALSILLINIVLVVFNMIPAFPMDGGRVLRSILAMTMPYVNATRWAQRIGMLCAVLMAAFALSSDPPRIVMVLIAGFIAFAGLAEVRQVELRDVVDGLRVGDVMTTNLPAVRAETPADQLWQWWKSYPGQAAAVVGLDGMLLGQIRLQDLVAHVKTAAANDDPHDREMAGIADTDSADPRWQTRAIELAHPQADVLTPTQSLEGLFGGGNQGQREFAVIDPVGRLIGWIDLNTVLQRAAIVRAQHARGEADRV